MSAARFPATGSKGAPLLPSSTDYPRRRRRRQLNIGCSCLQLLSLSEQVNHRTANCREKQAKVSVQQATELGSRVSDSPGVKLNRKSTNHLGWLAGKQIHLSLSFSPDARCWVVVRGERERELGRCAWFVGAESGLNRQSIARRLLALRAQLASSLLCLLPTLAALPCALLCLSSLALSLSLSAISFSLQLVGNLTHQSIARSLPIAARPCQRRDSSFG